MDEIKDQKIVVMLTMTESDENLIRNGIQLATIFRKELYLLFNNQNPRKKIPDNWNQRLEEHTLKIKAENPNLKISNKILSESKKKLPERLADDDEAILIVASSATFSIYSGALAGSPVPFLFVDENSPDITAFRKIILGIDLRSENKDSALWSSYFGRFNKSEIIVVAANDRSKDGQHKVAKNLIFAKRLYKKFKLSHKIFKGTKSSFGNAFEALDLAHSSGSDLLIILGSSTITPLDWLIGLPERKIIKKAGTLPVLIVNPRIDNYILCD